MANEILFREETEKALQLTRGIANKGFGGMQRVVTCFNFSYILIGNRPQLSEAVSFAESD